MIALVIFAALALSGPVRVVDGDTFDAGGVRYRIEGLDAADPFRPDCKTEAREARRATAALRRLLASGAVSVNVTRIQPARGHYRERSIARVTVNGRDVADAMISGGYGVRWRGRAHNWCELDRK